MGLGGCYAPETLMQPLLELEAAFIDALADPAFMAELRQELRLFVGRPTPLTPAPRLAREVGLESLWLKREDLAHTGAHKINNALGQALLARRMGKPRSSPRPGGPARRRHRRRLRAARSGLHGASMEGRGHGAPGPERGADGAV